MTPSQSLTRAAVACLLLVPAALAAPARSTRPEDVGFSSERLKRIDEMVERRIAAGDISGAVTAVTRRGQLVHFSAHGVADLDTKKPMTRESLFRLASTTKPVTAVAVLMLMEEGKLRLTDSVARFIPEFVMSKVAGKETEAARRSITILDLLTHTSGLATGGPGTPEFGKIMDARKPEEGLADMVPRFGSVPLDFQPGTQWRYSGLAGFDILARIVEVASGMKFDEFLRKRLFVPLGMNSTWFADIPQSELPRLVTIYQKTPQGLKKIDPFPIITSPAYTSGAGGLTSTVGDFLKFAQMLCNGGQLNGVRILSPWTVDLMMSNQVGDLFNGQIGRPPKGMGFGLGGEVVLHAVDARVRRPDGSFGWDGAYGTYWWVNRKEQMVTVLFVQTPGRAIHADFDNAVSQAVVE